jgi:hypothetical protein
MKVKLSEIINAQQSLQVLSSTQFPPDTGKLAYAIARNIRKLDIEIKSFEDVRNKLFESYGEAVEEPDEKTGEVKKLKRIKKENIEQFQKEVNEILEKEIEVDIWKIKYVELQPLGLKPIILVPIAFIIEE